MVEVLAVATASRRQPAGSFPLVAGTAITQALHGRFLDRSVHPFDLAVGPGMARPLDFARESRGEPVIDVALGAGQRSASALRLA